MQDPQCRVSFDSLHMMLQAENVRVYDGMSFSDQHQIPTPPFRQESH